MRTQLDLCSISWHSTVRGCTLLLLLFIFQFRCVFSDVRGMLPVVQCFSCMSKDLQKDFQILSRMYLPQASFDDRCNDPFSSKGIPLVNCSNSCVTLKEPESRLGVVLGQNYIRGCIDKIFVKGFLNRTALDVHRFHFEDTCRSLPWHQLMTHGNYKSGEVIFCSCYGNRCNTAARSLNSPLVLSSVLCILTTLLYYSYVYS